jgi:glycosyltransferase involved in cell wall biosynthesis
MIEQPLVSILMTSYNRQQYIAEAIKSVLQSTYTNFELIVVDDCSKDNTVKIAREYETRDARVKVYINEQNLGDYPNRNKAASYASGKYLKYVDADDSIYPWGIELLVLMMERFPEAGWGLCSLDQYVNAPFPIMLTPKEAYIYHYKGAGLFHKAPLSSIIKREMFNAVGGFSSIRMAGDYEMWHRLAQKYNVVLMPQGLVWYREHGEQEMNSYFAYQQVYESIKVQYLRDQHCPLDPAVTRSLLREHKAAIRKSLLKNIITMKVQRAMSSMKKLQLYK